MLSGSERNRREGGALPIAKTRVIVTTDMEVDDMNSAIHLALYLNELDVEAFVYTASQYHFQGDGKHTLAEVNPHWRTKGRRSYEEETPGPDPDPEAGTLTRYRPFPESWLESLWENEYAEAYPYLSANAEGFPTPAELIARTYVGNVAFEGDVREDTPGSDAIKAAILDDDPRALWLLSWGGMNTIVRALMSIAEQYHGTSEWEGVRAKVCEKVHVMGVMEGIGQDNSWLDHGRRLFPKLTFWRVPFSYGGYVDAKFAQPDSVELFKAPWPDRNITHGNGPLMSRYMLYGDGRHYEEEPERFQFGEHATLDWGLPGTVPLVFDPGDFMAEGDSTTFMPLLPFGLRGLDDQRFDTVLGKLFRDGDEAPEGALGFVSIGDMFKPKDTNPNPFLRAYQEDFAARAQWCAHPYESCNHAPVISDVSADVEAVPGETVNLSARATDPDGDGLFCRWVLYAADGSTLWEAAGLEVAFTVPINALPGDFVVLTLVVRDGAERPMTSYAQVGVSVRSWHTGDPVDEAVALDPFICQGRYLGRVATRCGVRVRRSESGWPR